MRDGLHSVVVGSECGSRYFFAVTSRAQGLDIQFDSFFCKVSVHLQEPLLQYIQRFAEVVGVKAVDYLIFLIQQYEFGSGAARIDADVAVNRLLFAYSRHFVHLFHLLLMPLDESFLLTVAAEKRDGIGIIFLIDFQHILL